MSLKLTTEEFINKAKNVHGDIYDYTKVDYKNYSTKVKIICPKHGPFYQIPGNHLYGNGCPTCGKKIIGDKLRNKSKIFLKKALETHGNHYNYSQIIYKGMHEKIKIICPIHGAFMQTPSNHVVNKQGCPKCGKINQVKHQSKSKKEFIDESQRKHRNKYNYSQSKYINNSTKVKIICPEHGSFYQLPTNHLNLGHGCPKCANYGFDPNLPAILYYLFDPQENLYKIGITNKTVEERFGKTFCSNRAIAILEQKIFDNGEEAYFEEQTLLEEFDYARCENPSWPETKGGRTEFFKEDILNKHEGH